VSNPLKSSHVEVPLVVSLDIVSDIAWVNREIYMNIEEIAEEDKAAVSGHMRGLKRFSNRRMALKEITRPDISIHVNQKRI